MQELCRLQQLIDEANELYAEVTFGVMYNYSPDEVFVVDLTESWQELNDAILYSLMAEPPKRRVKQYWKSPKGYQGQRRQ